MKPASVAVLAVLFGGGGYAICTGFICRPLHCARTDHAAAQLRAFEMGVALFKRDCGRVPTDDEGLGALVDRPAGCSGWKPYLDAKTIPLDPWGTAYRYSTAQIFSAGPDQAFGTSDDVVGALDG